MNIIKVDATDSTNTYLKELLRSGTVTDGTVVTARDQRRGRGQRNALWISEAGKNLTFSIFKRFDDLLTSDAFWLNTTVSMALARVLMAMGLPEIKVKWPNDILSGRSKLCGILIENSVAGGRIKNSVIGIGLNVNQTVFEGLENVSSVKALLQREMDLDALLMELLLELERSFAGRPGAASLKAYEALLYGKDMPLRFADAQGREFMGTIKGISPEGLLVMALPDGSQKEFGANEVQLLY